MDLFFGYCSLFDSQFHFKYYSFTKSVPNPIDIPFFLDTAPWLWFGIYLGSDSFCR